MSGEVYDVELLVVQEGEDFDRLTLSRTDPVYNFYFKTSFIPDLVE